ncbi:guanine nucleotide-binding protein G(o) subunit alpha-like [Chelonia mydas]|uniref:guanine nucleotide-binding protein G(o) subunit alpha-like n=1 Tax=Chelonia mydas TaxID=8469 RepID=UPI001CA9E7E1|nr:guanine nucleotide-binding protein G(o) subunit alpha-like [Chelonia mydas]
MMFSAASQPGVGLSLLIGVGFCCLCLSSCSWKLWLLYGSAEALASRTHAVSLRTWNGSSIPSSGRRQVTCFVSNCAQVASLRLTSGSRTWRFGEMRGQRMRLTGNRLQESMKLFSSVCNNVFFQSTSLILFLNKIDLLQEKILHLGRLLCLSFPQYPGADCDVGAAARCITSLFLSCSETPQKLIYHHVSTATDTCSVQGVFHVVTDTIVQENLEAAALL